MKKISRFEIKETVGAGAMSTVHRAIDSASGEIVAIKLLHPHHISSDLEKRFKREAKALLALKHPNIIQIREFGMSEEGQHFSVWDFEDGQTLSSFIERERRIQPDLAAMMILELGRGVNAAHELGIIHRDLKPANILVNKQGQLKISDFGLMHFKDNAEFTKPGTRVGSPAFMSPEQIRGVRPTSAMDVFSLGVIFYLLLTGELPFKGKTRKETFELIRNGLPQTPSSLVPHVPETLSELCLAMLGKGSEKRITHASDLVNRLEKHLDRVGLEPHASLLEEYLLHPRDKWEDIRRELLNTYLRIGKTSIQTNQSEMSLDILRMILFLTGVADQPSQFPDDLLPTKKVTVSPPKKKSLLFWVLWVLGLVFGFALLGWLGLA